MDVSQIEAIIFDNDGVLVDSEAIHVAVERELLAEMGLAYDLPTYMARFVGLANADFHAALASDHEARLGTPFPDDFRSRLDARVWPRMEVELRALPGVQDLVSTFAGSVAVASSATVPRLHQKLELTGLTEVFAPHIYSADYVERGKPAPDLFQYAARKLSVAPERCLVIEDSLNGVRAGRAAGMLTIGFTGGGHVDAGHQARLFEAGAHHVIAHHDELSTAFKSRI